jgi:hypothetical protein
MTEAACASCGRATDSVDRRRPISAALCERCLNMLAAGADPAKCREIMRGIDAPVLLMQPNPRLVYAANEAALALFNRSVHETDGRRGGEVFGCIHSFTVAGCGKDVNCDTCRIKAGIVDTFGGTVGSAINATLIIRGDVDVPYSMTISTEPVGPYALMRIDEFRMQEAPSR